MVFSYQFGRVTQIWSDASLAEIEKMHPDLPLAEADTVEVGMAYESGTLSAYLAAEPVLTQQIVGEIKAEIDAGADAIYKLYATRGWEYDAKVIASEAVIADPDMDTPQILQGMIDHYGMNKLQAAESVIEQHTQALNALVVVSNTRMKKGGINVNLSFDDAMQIKNDALAVYRQIQSALA